MTCENYNKLTPVEKVIFTGQLLHACMNDDGLKELGDEIIKLAMLKGLFEGVKILPETES